METLIQECHSVSNVTILCQDGLMNTHKIILAGISDIIKSILAEIPVGDQVTLFMPDFRAEDIERFLLRIMKGSITDQNVDLARAFGITPQIPDGNVRIKIIAENLKRECDEIDDKDEFKMYNPSEAEEDIEDEDIEDIPGVKKEEHGVNCMKKNMRKSYKVRSVKAAGMMMTSVEDFQEKIRCLEEKIITSPKSKKECIKNKRTKMSINFQKAFSDIIHSGLSVKDAAIKYNIPRTTLGSLLKSGKFEWHGRGKRSNYFTEEEEDKICRMALDRSGGGLNLNTKLLREVITEEIATILSIDPEREFRDINDTFTRCFGNKHDLLKPAATVKKKSVREGYANEDVEDNIKQHIESARISMSIEGFQEKIRLLEEQMIESPKTEKDRIKNVKTQKNIQFQKAFSDIIYNESSINHAARKFNVPRTTLGALLRSGKFEWNGRGRNSLIFTAEEEKRICKVALERSNGGVDMSVKLLKQVMIEEISLLQINEPERKFLTTDRFTIILGERHGLFNRVRELKDAKREGYEFECDICFKKYSLKNSLMFHKREVHFPFLK